MNSNFPIDTTSMDFDNNLLLSRMHPTPPPSYHNSSLLQQQLYENSQRHYTSTPINNLIYGGGSISGGKGTSPKVLNSLNNAFNGKGHHFIHANLSTPTKCISCTSILIGVDRQGKI